MNRIKKMYKSSCVFLCNKILKGTHFFKLKRLILNSCDGVKIGKGTKIVTPIHLPNLSNLIIGNDCWINRDFRLEGNGKVTIGNNVDIAPTVTCATGSHYIGDSNRRAGKGYCGNINIGEGSWIGIGSIILSNINIENSCIIAAGAVVTKNTFSNSLWGGVPARFLKELNNE